VEKWSKEYPKFGYDVLLSQESKYGELEGMEIELRSPKSVKKIRQFLVKEQAEILIFTCTSKTDDFLNVWKDCAKILSSSKRTVLKKSS
jgi:hypothetical protein